MRPASQVRLGHLGSFPASWPFGGTLSGKRPAVRSWHRAGSWRSVWPVGAEPKRMASPRGDLPAGAAAAGSPSATYLSPVLVHARVDAFSRHGMIGRGIHRADELQKALHTGGRCHQIVLVSSSTGQDLARRRCPPHGELLNLFHQHALSHRAWHEGVKAARMKISWCVLLLMTKAKSSVTQLSCFFDLLAQQWPCRSARPGTARLKEIRPAVAVQITAIGTCWSTDIHYYSHCGPSHGTHRYLDL